MIDGLKPYADRRDSGLPWLGKIPAHWEVRRTKTQFRLSIEKSGKAHGQELLSIYTHIGVRPRKDLEEKGNKASSTDDYWVVRNGDLIVNKLLAWMGAVGVSHYDGVTSPAYDILRPVKELAPDYYHYLFRTDLYKQQFKIRSRGIMEMRLRLYFDQLGQIPIPCPPPEEQAAIVRFLDHADRRIRRYIRAKRQLIALLNEQKQAIIHRAVTRGLDPHVKLKPSGVEWLGDVPEHWDVVPSRAMFTHRNEKAGPNDEILTASQTHGIVNRNEFIAREGRRVMQVITGREILKRVEANDFVISMRSFEGGLEWSQIQGAVSSAYVMLKPTHLVEPRYFSRLLKTRAYISALRRTSDLVRDGQALRYANFLQVPLPKVPLSEQGAIADYVESQNIALELAIQKTQDELRLMQEYRTRLIADIVAGKLDVRKAAVALPDELEAVESDAVELLDEDETTGDAELDNEPEEIET